MKATLIKSLPIVEENQQQVENLVPEELEILASVTEKHLHYSGLSSAIKTSKKEVGEKLAFAKLGQILRQLEIGAFEPNSVKSYKEEKLKEMQDKEKAPFQIWLVPLLCLGVCIFIGHHAQAKSSLEAICGLIGGLSSLCLLAGFIITMAKLEDVDLWEWQSVNLKDYTKPVPEFVIRKALQIKEKFPEANFVVHELIKRQYNLNGDPFLHVFAGGKEYCIEVWDEPKFEAKL